MITTYLNINMLIRNQGSASKKHNVKYAVHKAWEPLENAKRAEMHSIHHEFNSKAFHNTKSTKAQPK